MEHTEIIPVKFSINFLLSVLRTDERKGETITDAFHDKKGKPVQIKRAITHLEALKERGYAFINSEGIYKD